MSGQKAQKPQDTESGFFHGHIIVVAALCIMVTIYGAKFAFGVFFKPLSADFGWTRAMTSGAFSLTMVTHGLLGVIMGGLNDRLGPRLVLTLCGFIAGIGYFLMSGISTVWQFYLFYGVIIGAGMSGVWVPLLSTTARWFVARRSMMTGIVLTGTGIGTLVAPPIATWLISTYDWRKSYIIMGSIVLLVVVLTAQLLRRDPSQMGQIPYGANMEEEKQSLQQPEGFSLREAVCTRQFWMVLAILFFYGICFYAITIHIVPHITDIGISAINAANVLAASGGLAIVGRLILGAVADRIGNRRAIMIGFILMSASLFWLVPARDIWRLYLFAIVFGFAYGGLGASESPLVARLFGLRSHGLILGILSGGFTIGGALGPFLAGYIFDVNGSYQWAFIIYGAVSTAGLIITALLRPIKSEHSQHEMPSTI